MLNQTKSDCIYHFPIDLEPNGIQFGSKSIGKCSIHYDFSLIQQDAEIILQSFPHLQNRRANGCPQRVAAKSVEVERFGDHRCDLWGGDHRP